MLEGYIAKQLVRERQWQMTQRPHRW